MRWTPKKKHCWHDTGELLMSNPPQRVQQCCQCGRVGRATLIDVRQPGHGPFAPLEGVRRVNPDTSECFPKEAK